MSKFKVTGGNVAEVVGATSSEGFLVFFVVNSSVNRNLLNILEVTVYEIFKGEGVSLNYKQSL